MKFSEKERFDTPARGGHPQVSPSLAGQGLAGLPGLEEHYASRIYLDVSRGGEGHGPWNTWRCRNAQILVSLETVTEQAVDCTVVIISVGS